MSVLQDGSIKFKVAGHAGVRPDCFLMRCQACSPQLQFQKSRATTPLLRRRLPVEVNYQSLQSKVAAMQKHQCAQCAFTSH
jgi:hypothetical protein